MSEHNAQHGFLCSTSDVSSVRNLTLPESCHCWWPKVGALWSDCRVAPALAVAPSSSAGRRTATTRATTRDVNISPASTNDLLFPAHLWQLIHLLANPNVLDQYPRFHPRSAFHCCSDTQVFPISTCSLCYLFRPSLDSQILTAPPLSSRPAFSEPAAIQKRGSIRAYNHARPLSSR